MAALFARVIRQRFNWKNILSSPTTRTLPFYCGKRGCCSRHFNTLVGIKCNFMQKRCISVGPHLDVTYKNHVQRNCTSLLYTRNVKRLSPFFGARQYSDENGATNPGEMIGNNATVENPFITESPTAVEAVQTLNSLGEPTLSSLGLGGWSPIGIVQQAMELIHTSCGLPWFWTIVATTVVCRLLMFPVVVKSQANAARLNNINPQMTALQEQIRELSNTYDNIGKASASYKLQQLWKENNCHPLKSILGVLVQLPVFMSFFFGIKRMAQLPVESFQTGGILWFTDLTLSDPFFILPILSGVSMLATFELGDAIGVSNPRAQAMKPVFRIMTLVMVPVAAYFESAILVYWVTTNFFTVCQVCLLKLKTVRQFFDIPDMIIHEDQRKQSGTFFENMKDGFKSAQERAYIKQYEKMKRQKQRALGNAPVEPTYEHNPRIKNNQQIFSSPTKFAKNDKLKNKPGPKM